jgi:hypothetical protein
VIRFVLALLVGCSSKGIEAGNRSAVGKFEQHTQLES